MNKVEAFTRLKEVGLRPKFARKLAEKPVRVKSILIKGEIRKTEKIKTIFLLRFLMGHSYFYMKFANRKELFLLERNLNAWEEFKKKFSERYVNG